MEDQIRRVPSSHYFCLAARKTRACTLRTALAGNPCVLLELILSLHSASKGSRLQACPDCMRVRRVKFEATPQTRGLLVQNSQHTKIQVILNSLLIFFKQIHSAINPLESECIEQRHYQTQVYLLYLLTADHKVELEKQCWQLFQLPSEHQ